MTRGGQPGRWRGRALVGCLALVGVMLLVRATGTRQTEPPLRSWALGTARGPGAAAWQHKAWSHSSVQTAAAWHWQPVGLRMTTDDHPRAQATLAGLGPIAVVVEPLSGGVPDRDGARLTVQTAAERQLRAAGLRVAAAFAPPGGPYLAVNVNAAATTTTSGRLVGYAAAVRVSLVQDVQLARNPALRVNAPTWSAGLIVQGPSADVIWDAVQALVEKFAHAYMAVNPPAVPAY